MRVKYTEVYKMMTNDPYTAHLFVKFTKTSGQSFSDQITGTKEMRILHVDHPMFEEATTSHEFAFLKPIAVPAEYKWSAYVENFGRWSDGRTISVTTAKNSWEDFIIALIEAAEQDYFEMTCGN